MKIEATIPFTVRDDDTGELISVADGQVITVSDEVGAQFISDGLAKEFTLITPTGTKSITANGEVDVTTYAKANVAVPQPTGSIIITSNGSDIDVAQYAKADVDVVQYALAYDSNGGSGIMAPITHGGSDTVTAFPCQFTPPTGQHFKSWYRSGTQTEISAGTSFTSEANEVLKAQWEAD